MPWTQAIVQEIKTQANYEYEEIIPEEEDPIEEPTPEIEQ